MVTRVNVFRNEGIVEQTGYSALQYLFICFGEKDCLVYCESSINDHKDKSRLVLWQPVFICKLLSAYGIISVDIIPAPNKVSAHHGRSCLYHMSLRI